jgi:hypothetical protein
MRNVAREVDAVLLILDPLLSRLDDRLDTHKDADVRRALEPLVALAEKGSTSQCSESSITTRVAAVTRCKWQWVAKQSRQ